MLIELSYQYWNTHTYTYILRKFLSPSGCLQTFHLLRLNHIKSSKFSRVCVKIPKPKDDFPSFRNYMTCKLISSPYESIIFMTYVYFFLLEADILFGFSVCLDVGCYHRLNGTRSKQCRPISMSPQSLQWLDWPCGQPPSASLSVFPSSSLIFMSPSIRSVFVGLPFCFLKISVSFLRHYTKTTAGLVQRYLKVLCWCGLWTKLEFSTCKCTAICSNREVYGLYLEPFVEAIKMTG